MTLPGPSVLAELAETQLPALIRNHHWPWEARLAERRETARHGTARHSTARHGPRRWDACSAQGRLVRRNTPAHTTQTWPHSLCPSGKIHLRGTSAAASPHSQCHQCPQDSGHGRVAASSDTASAAGTHACKMCKFYHHPCDKTSSFLSLYSQFGVALQEQIRASRKPVPSVNTHLTFPPF